MEDIDNHSQVGKEHEENKDKTDASHPTSAEDIVNELNNDKTDASHPTSAEDIVNELIQKASIAEASSDEEYLSAEEDSENEDAYVVRSMNEDLNAEGENVCYNNNDEEEEEEEDDEQNGGDESREEKDKEEEEIIDELEERRKREELLTQEEIMERKESGQNFKNEGNTAFRNGNYEEAIDCYTKGLEISPLSFQKERAILFANRATCKMKENALEDAIKDSTQAIDIHPQYIKAILRRAELYEKTEKLDEAFKDYETVVQLDPSQHAARASCLRLQEQIKERNEKLKTEMMDKLKDLGNLVLRPFGLSTNNFKLQQDPNSGSYSVQFQQGAQGNGS